ncbi:MAG TPA: hypothetical protein VHL78_11955 [Actinomycetota bacterium]|nr:hypothetical protein [Actinomycetota bacterium]
MAGTAFWYAATIRGQGDSLLTARPLFVVSSLTAVALMAIAGTVVERPPATAALWAATGALMMLGLIGLFSIGLFLMLAGGLAALAAVGSGRRTGLRWAACLAAVLLGVAVAAGSFLAMASVD